MKAFRYKKLEILLGNRVENLQVSRNIGRWRIQLQNPKPYCLEWTDTVRDKEVSCTQ